MMTKASKAIIPVILIIASLSVLLLSGCTIVTAPHDSATITPPSTQTTQSPPPDMNPPEINLTYSLKESIDGNELVFTWPGIDNASPPDALTYSFYLKGWEPDYSAFGTATTETYRNLPTGSYTFYVKARDEAGNSAAVWTTVEITMPVATAPAEYSPPPVAQRLLILPGSDINRIAVSNYGSIIYALDSANSRLYKSEHAGIGWTSIPDTIIAPAVWNAMAIAPDNHDVIALVAGNGTAVLISNDGGTNFYDTQLTGTLKAGERVLCVAISPGYSNNTREIAVGTATGTGSGTVYINKISGFAGTWQDCSSSAMGWPAAGVDIFALRYSPDFPADGTLLAITAGSDDTFLFMGERDLALNTAAWNSTPGYPVEVCQQGQDTPGTPLTFTDIALPADYSGGIPSQRHVYVCWTDNPAGTTTAGSSSDGVYRIDDAICHRLTIQQDIICTVAHYGSFRNGKLLAGAMMSGISSGSGVQVYCSFNPMSTYPSWQKSQKPPTGKYNAQVGWSPDGRTAFCGTSNIQSAFSKSTDNGLTWNQIGLIDT